MILYNNSDDDNLFTDNHWVPSVHIDNTPGSEIKVYIADETHPMAEIKTGEVDKWKSATSMTIFSSRGPNTVAGDIIKPDMTAPGMQILAGYSPFPDPGSTPPGELYAAIAGTSMSSPHVAGLFALLKQAHPDWSPAAARSALMTTADQDVVDNDRSTQAGPFAMGSGHVDPTGSLSSHLWSRWMPVNMKGTPFDPGFIYEAGFDDYLGFLCGTAPEVFSDPAGTCAELEAAGIPTDASDLNYPSIGVAELAGSQTVTRTVTSVANRRLTYLARVDAPDGYEVSVSPRKLRLNPGETGTYEVTITNVSAPVGEWRDGSLTWKAGHYRNYSPIAVNAALFDAPSEAEGTGTSGSTSFDVAFGYTGSYAAAPHGLVADTPTNGNIGQDPDQTYPSADDGPVGVQKISYPISGAAFVRWELVIPGDDDIDLFLEDSSGTIIAASTSGGTDELIELYLPTDDTYTMVVHGWSVPSAPLPYTLHYWEVPLASGGSLSVDSAPTSAVLGTVGTVNVSWSGLAAGTTYLGAVSHTGDAGLMGLTLVSVDTP